MVTAKRTLTSTARLAIVYLVLLVVTSSITATFESLSPLATPEGPVNWYDEIGVRDGFFVVGAHEPPGGGWCVRLHPPELMPLPVWAGVGPEGGGFYVATWFAFGLVASAHFVLRSRRRRKSLLGDTATAPQPRE